MIPDPVVVKVHAGDNANDRNTFKRDIVSRLREFHGLVLTPNEDNHTLSTNQVNISVEAIATVLHDLGATKCRVLSFGMKWKIPVAEPKIDYFINRYFATVARDRRTAPNTFDYGVGDHEVNTNMINAFRFTDIQVIANGRQNQHFRQNVVYPMFMQRGSGSISFKPTFNSAFEEVKIYPELVHEVLSVLKRQTLDDMPKTVRTMQIRLNQLQKLLRHWEDMTPADRTARFLGSRVEATVRTHTVAEGRALCIREKVLRIRGIEERLRGPFDVIGTSIDTVLTNFRRQLNIFERRVHGSYTSQSTVRMRSALTKTRQSIGWSGKHMKEQLREHRSFQSALQRQRIVRQAPNYQYDGWQQDDAQDRPLIVDFLANARWIFPPRLRNRNGVTPMMLMNPNTGARLPITWLDQVGAARHFVGIHRANWRLHVGSNPANP